MIMEEKEAKKMDIISLPYKIVTLAFMMGNWLICLLLLIFNFKLYKIITVVALLYLFYCAVFACSKMVYAVNQTLNIISNEKKRNNAKLEKLQKLNYQHTFLIPNYKENIEVLRKTLENLASHEFSSHYIVVLGMQASENESAVKAIELVNEFQNCFKGIQYTVHVPFPGEAQGKAANVNWSAMRLQPLFQKYGINSDNVLITVIDADSIMPEIYIGELERKVVNENKNIHDVMFLSPHVYAVNRMDSMIFGRVFDNLYSFLHYITMPSLIGVSFPISNYTLSYKTLKEVGFNDVHKDAIAEDCHMTLKAISETQGRLTCVPIYIFSNQMSLVGGKSFLEEFKSKFWQEERHQRGVLQIAYAFRNVVRSNFRNKNIIYAFITVFQVYFDQIAGLWYTSFMVYQFLSSFFISSLVEPCMLDYIIGMGSLLMTLIILVAMLVVFYARFSFEVVFFKIKTFKQRIIEVIEAIVLFPVASVIFAQTAGIVAVIQLFNENSKYVTTEKRMSKV